MVIETSFLGDHLNLQDVALDRAWMGSNSTLFLRFKSAANRLEDLRAKRKLFSLPSKIFLDEDLTKSQVAELKCSREQVTIKLQAGKWAVLRNLRAIIRDSFPLGGYHVLGLPNDGPARRDNRV
jgi:hypothetical protein